MAHPNKHYHVVRKNKADTGALLRALVAAYLVFMAYRLAFHGGDDPTFPPALGYLFGGLFLAAAIAFGVYTWRRYQADLRAAQLTPEEEEELRREREEEQGL